MTRLETIESNAKSILATVSECDISDDMNETARRLAIILNLTKEITEHATMLKRACEA